MATSSGMSVDSDGPAQSRLADAQGRLQARAFEFGLEQRHARVEYFRAGRHAGRIALPQDTVRLFACRHGFLCRGNRRPSRLDLIDPLLDVHGDPRVEFGQAMIDRTSLCVSGGAVRLGAPAIPEGPAHGDAEIP